MYAKDRGVYKEISSLAGITIGASVMGLALSVFLVPCKIAPGGISGLATVIYYLTGIRVSVLIPLINIPIFIGGLLCFDKWFLLRSLYGTIALSVMTEIMTAFQIPLSDTLLAGVFGGAIMGLGISMVLRTGGSTGGTDILVLTLRKFIPFVSVGTLFMIIDGAVILTAGLVFKSWETVLYSSMALFVSGRVTDSVLEGVNYARMVYIISPKEREITDRIYKDLNRGVTALNSHSMYSDRDGRILLCVIRKRQLPKLKMIISEVDPKAFVIIGDAKEVMGNGFYVN